MLCSLSVISLCQPTGPEAYGLARLLDALRKAGVDAAVTSAPRDADGPAVIVGRRDRTAVRRLAAENRIALPSDDESAWFGEAWSGARRILLVTGGGSAGLMYAALELAERVAASGMDAIETPDPFCESPHLAIRGVNRFLSGHLDEAWLHSDEFWEWFLDTLARSRLNRFVLITGFDTAYLSPPYPSFVDVPGYPGVQVRGLAEAGRAKNLERLRRIGAMCADRAIEFVIGIWQQLPWQSELSRLVDGLPEDESKLAAYCAAGLRELLIRCPEISGVHLRVNHESGVGTQNTAEEFWNTLTDAVASCGRAVRLDLRAKGLTDGMISHALEAGLEVSVPTKYWCEQTGLPHHLTQMRSQELSQLANLNHARRYSYSDLLDRPRSYEMIYRLWNLGATNLFLWGDPDYVRRFCASMRVGDAPGFEFASPLSLKWGHELRQREAWPLHVDAKFVSYRFEDERYWYLYVLFGRLGYSLRCPTDVLSREFGARFGDACGAHVARAYASASRVIPLVTAFHMPQHPMLHYWPELSTGGALFAQNQGNHALGDVTYGAAEPSDPGLFVGIDEYSAGLAAERAGGRYTPLQVSSWLAAFASGTREALADATESDDFRGGPEWEATRVDFLMLADLADYHAHKIRAAVHLAIAELSRTNGQADTVNAARACESMRAATTHWRELSACGSRAYHDPLDFQAGASSGRYGHWKDALPELEADLALLEERAGTRADGRPDTSRESGAPDLPPGLAATSIVAGALSAPARVGPGEPVPVELLSPVAGMTRVVLRYRHTDQTEGAFRQLPMQWSADRYVASVPGGYVTPGKDILVYATGDLSAFETAMAPGLYHPTEPLPYLLVTVG